MKMEFLLVAIGYWRRNPYIMMRTACSPPVSHPPLHLPLAHIRQLSHPRFRFGSSLCTAAVGSAPLPHPCCFLTCSPRHPPHVPPLSTLFLYPAFIFTSFLAPPRLLRVTPHELFTSTSHLGIWLFSDRLQGGKKKNPTNNKKALNGQV